MFRILMPLLLLAGNAYVLLRIWQLLPAPVFVKIAVVLAWVALLGGFFIGFARGWEWLPVPLATVAYEASNTWAIAFLYLLIAFLLLDLGRLAHIVPAGFLKGSVPGTAVVFGLIAILLPAGNLHYRHKYRETLTVTSPKVTAPVRIVLASDLHAGYHNRKKEITRWAEMIDAEEADLVLIGGDIVDRDLKPVLEGGYAEAFRSIRAPVFACPGNHEFYAGLAGSEAFLEAAGIRLLRDEALSFGELDIIGRDDRTNPARKTLPALTEGRDTARFSILLDHQPYHLEEAEAAHVDFQFSGHTHRGQVWPLSWITDGMYEKAWGHHRRGGTRYYISSGLGIWGPKVRIGTRSEYLVLQIEPE